MEEGNDLDSLITNSAQSGLDGDSAMTAENISPAQRPKMKKIKRAKVRLATPIPPVPEKIMPISGDTDNSIDIVAHPTDQTAQTETAALQQVNDLDALVSNISQTNTHSEQKASKQGDILQEMNTGTELVTSSDAQEMAFTQEESPYILEGLPPELDYETDEAYESTYESDSGYIKKSIFYAVSCACLLVGLFVGKTLFSSQTVENHGLEGVVLNPDVPAGRPRCGLTDKSQACTFYMMNWYKQELNGRDFYKLAAQLTGRETYMIETDNLRYSTVKIRPGAIAQLNIPALLK